MVALAVQGRRMKPRSRWGSSNDLGKEPMGQMDWPMQSNICSCWSAHACTLRVHTPHAASLRIM